ncbi:unnamed protein product [Ixodes hexagonus]
MKVCGLVALLALLVACKAQEELKLTLASNRFGLRLLNALSSATDENVCFSPYSVSAAMGMAYSGARTDTREELFRGFGYSGSGLTAAQVLDSYARHTQSLFSPESESILKVANGVAVQKNLTLLDSFTNTLASSFNAQVHQVDFEHEEQEAVDLINEWTKQKTMEKIDKLFERPLSKETKLVLLNAIYFKGAWYTQFDPELTHKRQFWNNGVTSTEVDMMTTKFRRIGYGSFSDLDADVVELMYRGRDYSMVILLPKRNDGVDALRQNLTVEIVRNMITDLSKQDVDVFLPRFKLECSYELRDPLTALGIRQIFTSGADLSGITGREGLLVSSAVHKSVLEVNEEGSEAAAATALVIRPGFPRPLAFIADHPFLLFIRNTRTNDIIFAVQVNKL